MPRWPKLHTQRPGVPEVLHIETHDALAGISDSGLLNGLMAVETASRGCEMGSVVRGTCHHDCPDSCGWLVTVEERVEGPVAVRMGGDPDHPYSQGSLCPKVVPFLDRVYSPQRILEPLRRVGRKGEGQFRSITWNEALAEIGHRLNAILAEHGGEAIVPWVSAGKALRRDGRVRVAYPATGVPFPDGVFPTPSGKVELASESLSRMGHPRLPAFIPASESPWGNPALAQRYPFILLTPKQHRRFLNSSYADLPKHGPKEGGPYVELNAEDAARLGLGEGDEATVWNDRASLRLTVRITDRLRSGVVAIPWGWWSRHHPDQQTANSLTSDALTDWGGGTAFNSTLVAVGTTSGIVGPSAR